MQSYAVTSKIIFVSVFPPLGCDIVTFLIPDGSENESSVFIRQRFLFTQIIMHDAFPMQNSLKQGAVLSLLLLYFALGYAARTIKENHEGINLKATLLTSDLC